MNPFLAVSYFLFAISPASHAEESAVLAAISESGGMVSQSKDGGWEIGFQHSGRRLTDEQLAPVAALKNVVVLNLRDTQITGAGLEHLKGLSELRRLHLERTAVDDAGIAHLAGLKNLEYLNLYSTEITDAALGYLTGLENLEQLYVWQTGVTDGGVSILQRAVPDLRIVRGIDFSKVEMERDPPVAEQRVALDWIPAGGEDPPKSKSGDFITVIFENKRGGAIKLFWVEYGGGLRHYADIEAGATRLQTTYSDATWIIKDEAGRVLGHFRTGGRIATAVIPKDA